jgi:hypothetical protein
MLMATDPAGGFTLDLLPELEDGLTDIEGYSHLCARWVVNRAASDDLLLTPSTAARPDGIGHDPPVSRADHTISAEGLSGGGQVPLPGEVSKRARPACSC